MKLPGVPAETPAISRSPAAGEKPDRFEYQCSSRSGFPPACALAARRFRLGFMFSNAIV